jgi:hypothetical protein
MGWSARQHEGIGMSSVRPLLRTPVGWPLRAWLVAEVFFGLAAISAVFFFPEQTATNFAWTIPAVVMAAVIGAFYLSTGFLFALGLSVRNWENVRVIVLPAIVFTTLELLVTIIHWDRFNQGTLPFYVWFASYLLPPPIFAVLYWWHQRRAAPVGTGVAQPLPRWFRWLCLINGGVYVLVAGALLVVPEALIAQGPWPFTPLTARALCGWLVAVGLLLLSMAWENDWSRARLASVMLLVLGPALLFQLLRYSAQVRWTNPWLLISLADLLLLSLIMLAMWLRHPTRQSAPTSMPDPSPDPQGATQRVGGRV